MTKSLAHYHRATIDIGHSIDEQPQDLPVHIHQLYEIYFLLTGDVTYYIEGQGYSLKRHDILIINSQELHRPIFDSDTPYERIVIHFRPEYISPYQTEEYNLLHCFQNRNLGQYNRIARDDVLKSGLDQSLWKIIATTRHTGADKHLMLQTLFIQTLITLNQIFDSYKAHKVAKSGYDNKIAQILDYMNRHLHEKITLDRLQEEFYVSKYYLCHLFKQNTGFTVGEYLTYKRVSKAKELLNLGNPAGEVCHAVGYGDYSNFYRVFHRLVGVSPRRYIG